MWLCTQLKKKYGANERILARVLSVNALRELFE
jgi:hypothetical protein